VEKAVKMDVIVVIALSVICHACLAMKCYSDWLDIGARSNRQGGYAIVVVCLSVSNFAQKRQNGFLWNFHGRLAV